MHHRWCVERLFCVMYININILITSLKQGDIYKRLKRVERIFLIWLMTLWYTHMSTTIHSFPPRLAELIAQISLICMALRNMHIHIYRALLLTPWKIVNPIWVLLLILPQNLGRWRMNDMTNYWSAMKGNKPLYACIILQFYNYIYAIMFVWYVRTYHIDSIKANACMFVLQLISTRSPSQKQM